MIKRRGDFSVFDSATVAVTVAVAGTGETRFDDDFVSRPCKPLLISAKILSGVIDADSTCTDSSCDEKKLSVDPRFAWYPSIRTRNFSSVSSAR
jgi:hypothetical protein